MFNYLHLLYYHRAGALHLSSHRTASHHITLFAFIEEIREEKRRVERSREKKKMVFNLQSSLFEETYIDQIDSTYVHFADVTRIGPLSPLTF